MPLPARNLRRTPKVCELQDRLDRLYGRVPATPLEKVARHAADALNRLDHAYEDLACHGWVWETALGHISTANLVITTLRNLVIQVSADSAPNSLCAKAVQHALSELERARSVEKAEMSTAVQNALTELVSNLSDKQDPEHMESVLSNAHRVLLKIWTELKRCMDKGL